MMYFKKFPKTVKHFISGDERGAMAYITIFAAVPLCAAMFYIVNNAKSIQDKTRTQDGADMAALAHATEGARAMNTIAMNQVTNTQAFVVQSTSGTLFDLAWGQTLVGAAQEVTLGIFEAKECLAGFGKIPPPPAGAIAAAACSVPVGILAIEIAEQIIRAQRILSDYKPKEAHKLANNAIKSNNKQNEEIIKRYPRAASAAAQQVAEKAKVKDIYFDDRCKSNCNNTGGVARDNQLGMKLPVMAKNTPWPSVAGNFCLAMYLGSAGTDVDMPDILGLSLGGSMNNGSYAKRGFPILTGPMRVEGGMVDHVNDETGIGELLKDNYNTSRRKMLVPFPVGLESVYSYSKNIAGWPTKQKQSDNYFTQWMALKIANLCLGDPLDIPVLSILSDGLLSSEKIDMYHPDGLGLIPKIMPQLNDFTDIYKPLAFTVRRANKRWMPKVFEDTNRGNFYTYSQGIVYNKDEISLYSQNWHARLIPAEKMSNTSKLSSVVSRMGSDAANDFSDLKTDLDKVKSDSTWGKVVAK